MTTPSSPNWNTSPLLESALFPQPLFVCGWGKEGEGGGVSFEIEKAEWNVGCVLHLLFCTVISNWSVLDYKKPGSFLARIESFSFHSTSALRTLFRICSTVNLPIVSHINSNVLKIVYFMFR